MRKGSALVLVSAAAFGTMAVFAHHGHEAGLDVPTLMLLRFSIASVALWLAALIRRDPLPRGRTLGLMTFMGVVYFGQSFCFFAALRHIPAALVSLLLYLYPVIVTVGSVAFFHERLNAVKLGALALALVGTALTIGRVQSGDSLGITLAVGSAFLYSLYLLLGTYAGREASPVPMTAVVTGSTALCYFAFDLAQGFAPINGAGFGWGLALAAASVVALGGLLAGLPEVGPVNASVLSAVEPIVTALLAAMLLGQTLQPIQLVGGALILLAVVVLVRSRGATEPAR
jgi:drug/metabolite transporter (DMT)-like permease